MTVLGMIAAVVVLASAVVLVVSWPTTPQRLPALPIRLYAYDPVTAHLADLPQDRFRQGQIPVATIDEGVAGALAAEPAWASWYDAFGHRTNSVDLAGLDDLRARPLPLSATSAVPAGRYQFVLASVRGNRTEEVLAWVHVDIER
ncbi:hypothetical protein [Micromonospora echinofusca]|uniref:DUF2771 domain-containing protein n=1 Tax=Micromonospora echinofusca TaxID=47858 RepID=A0ABS3VJ02_MICEH|nr:hypothetical protein [Micromonospora echinofusca]MBO4204461.1 hypothetical protein [Micromonospora echinofusca]